MWWLLSRLDETLRLDSLRGLGDRLLRDIGMPYGTMRRETGMDRHEQTHRLGDETVVSRGIWL